MWIMNCVQSKRDYKCWNNDPVTSLKNVQELTQSLTAVQGGSKAAGVGVDGDVGGRGVQQWISDDDGVDDALTGDGVEHRHALL